MATIRPRDLLTGDLLGRLGGHGDTCVPLAGLSAKRTATAWAGSEMNARIARDIDKLRAAGYLKVALPAEFGGMGCTLRQAACSQRQLTYRAPLTALAVSAHLYWTGAAADAYRCGDTSAKWILLEAARGALFAGGHGLPGNDLRLASPLSRCEVAGESGYRFRSRGVLAGLTPGWDWMAVHAITSPEQPAASAAPKEPAAPAEPATVLAFAGRGSRCTPSYRVARVFPGGSPADIFATSAIGWGSSLLASVQYSIARTAFNRAVAAVTREASVPGPGHPLDRWPVAEASLRLDGIKARIADVTHVWTPHSGRSADKGGRELIKVFTMRHEVRDGARLVLDLVAQIADAPAGTAPAAVAR
jgi:alkylation response protein AidB-like acyl-CoA dehydrogenase